jgi:energy-coupling factor transporter transmembrane protein EcfT
VGFDKLPGRFRIAVFVVSTATALLVSGWYLLAVAGSLVAAALVFEPSSRRLLCKARFWLLIFSPLPMAVLVFGEIKPPLFGVSLEELRLPLEMSLRALCLLMALQLLVSGLTVSRLMRWFERHGLKGLGFAFGVAQNMLSTLTETVEGAFISIRLRGGFRRRPLYALGLFLVTVVASTLSHADQIVHAACARAFDPSSGSREAQSPGCRTGRRFEHRPAVRM